MKARILLPFAASFLLSLPGLAAKPQVLLETSMGDIVVELEPEKAPKSVENFLSYVDAGYYDGTIFHRVIKQFMIQGGGFTTTGQKKATRAPIENEAKNGLKNERGTLAMARTNDIHSATSQFYINLVDNGFLNHSGRNYGYAVFGKVVRGLEIVDKIGQTPTGSCPPVAARDCPATQMVIRKASRADAATQKERAARKAEAKNSSLPAKQPALKKK